MLHELAPRRRETEACNTNLASERSELTPQHSELDPRVPSQIRESGISLRGSWSWIGESRSQIRAV